MENIINGKLNGQTAKDYGYSIAQAERFDKYCEKEFNFYAPTKVMFDYERSKRKLSKLGVEFRLYFKEVDKHIQEYNNKYN